MIRHSNYVATSTLFHPRLVIPYLPWMLPPHWSKRIFLPFLRQLHRSKPSFFSVESGQRPPHDKGHLLALYEGCSKLQPLWGEESQASCCNECMNGCQKSWVWSQHQMYAITHTRKMAYIFGPEVVPLSPFSHANQKEDVSAGNELWLRRSFNHLTLEPATDLSPSAFPVYHSRDPLQLCHLWI